MRYVLLIIMLTFAIGALAQVEHNFEMDPENTDCHLIDLKGKSVGELVEDIRKRNFRVSQKIRISKYRTPHELEYFSCNGKTGFVLALLEEGRYDVFTEVTLDAWNSMQNSKDILEYYRNIFLDRNKAYSPKRHK